MTALDKTGRWFARTGWAHLTLLCFAGIFLFPFVWMVGMSLKTDDEAVSTDIFPSVPTFRAQSPVIREPIAAERPQGVPKEKWDEMVPVLVKETRKSIDQLPLPPGGDAVDGNALRETAARSLTSMMVEKLPEKLWIGERTALLMAYKDLLTPSVLSEAFDAQLGRLEFRGLQIHSLTETPRPGESVASLDAHIYSIDSGSQIASDWKVESGAGQLLPAGKDASFVKYKFSSGGDAPVVLRYDFDAHVLPADLHKLIVSMQGDDSWHRIDATLDLGDKHFKSDLSTYIAQYRASSLTFQPPGFDDTTYQPRTWIPLVETNADTKQPTPTSATLRLIIRPSSTLGAIYGKVQRNYLRAFRSIPFWTYVTNSVLLVVLQMAGALLSAAFVAYAFARLQWPGRAVAFGILLSTMMLPSQVTMIPSFVLWRSLGWFNTLNPLWVPAWFGSAFFIFLMTQNMKTIPKELEEAARIDGLNALQTWWYIILPLVKPTLAAIAIMVFMGAWNDFMGPLIMLRDQSRYPLSLGLFGMHIDEASDSTLIMAGNMLMTLPVVMIFFLFQRYFIEGVTVSGMKG